MYVGKGSEQRLCHSQKKMAKCVSGPFRHTFFDVKIGVPPCFSHLSYFCQDWVGLAIFSKYLTISDGGRTRILCRILGLNFFKSVNQAEASDIFHFFLKTSVREAFKKQSWNFLTRGWPPPALFPLLKKNIFSPLKVENTCKNFRNWIMPENS